MKYLINLVIIAAVGLFGYLLYSGINEPIKFRTELDARKAVVTGKLEKIRTAQDIYRQIKGQYASSFEELSSVLKTDSIPFRQLLADPEDPENPDKFIVNIVKFSAADSLRGLAINLDDLPYVPYTNKAERFEVQADTMTYQSTLVPVVEVMTTWGTFMGAYNDPKFSMYQKEFNPRARIGFGSMSSPNLEGNWK